MAGVLIWVAEIVSFIAIFVILFTKEISAGDVRPDRDPDAVELRGHAYAYWMVDRYPPFTWEE